MSVRSMAKLLVLVLVTDLFCLLFLIDPHSNRFKPRNRCCRFIPVRSPGRRLAELLFLVLVTGTLWFAASYASPCRTLPNAVRRRHCKYKLQFPRDVHVNTVFCAWPRRGAVP